MGTTPKPGTVPASLSGPRRIFSSPRALELSPQPNVVISHYPGKPSEKPADKTGFEEHEVVTRVANTLGRHFKDLLSIVAWNLSLIRQEETPSTQGLVEDAASAVQSGQELIEALEFIADGRSSGWEERVDVAKVAQEVGALCKRTLDSKILLDVRVQARDTNVVGNATRLHQALLALAINASESVANTSAPRITIEVREPSQLAANEKSSLLVSVLDNGRGMLEEVRARVGEPFFTTKRPNGIGLGYAIVGSVVREMGGLLDVASAENEGTFVSITFPRA